jgi:RHS repeat-associated protein
MILELETMLYYDRARYMDSAQGCFPRRDPVGTIVPASNLYAHVTDDPVRSTDPAGYVGFSRCLYV